MHKLRVLNLSRWWAHRPDGLEGLCNLENEGSVHMCVGNLPKGPGTEAGNCPPLTLLVSGKDRSLTLTHRVALSRFPVLVLSFPFRIVRRLG